MLSVSKMQKGFTESHRRLLCLLFWVFESLLVAAVVTAFCTADRHKISPLDDAVGLTFWFAFIGMFVVSFMLRRQCRRLAITGWWSLFISFWSFAFFPVL